MSVHDSQGVDYETDTCFIRSSWCHISEMSSGFYFNLCFIVLNLLSVVLPLYCELMDYLCMQLVARLSKDIVETFQLCNPNFKYSEVLNPKRFLTNPSVGVLNDGNDNANSDLILHVNSVLVNSTKNQRFVLIMSS